MAIFEKLNPFDKDYLYFLWQQKKAPISFLARLSRQLVADAEMGAGGRPRRTVGGFSGTPRRAGKTFEMEMRARKMEILSRMIESYLDAESTDEKGASCHFSGEGNTSGRA